MGDSKPTQDSSKLPPPGTVKPLSQDIFINEKKSLNVPPPPRPSAPERD